ncbi:hypothetical protein [Burkholderia diffusa]|uniref:hypothetical protein n=1 Tax=Burkholderia diffusa TaxID=488732 RepID=UPI0012D876AF|nr:hypothetical protein [Burkholderia diffusa]
METIDAIAIAIQINRMAPFIIDGLDIQKIHGLLDRFTRLHRTIRSKPACLAHHS